MEVGSWKMGVGRWEMEVGRWEMGVGSKELGVLGFKNLKRLLFFHEVSRCEAQSFTMF
jgi:hypothetical protein